jgi:hypothetical protein
MTPEGTLPGFPTPQSIAALIPSAFTIRSFPHPIQ